MKRSFLLASIPALATLSPAQFPSSDEVPDRVRAPDHPPVALGAWHVPFGSTDETGTAWAAGPDYKVAVDGGMTFHPVLGSDAPENLPWRWSTTSIRRGSRTLASGDGPASLRAEGFRAEVDRGSVVEVYDVRPDGVEQLFVLERDVARLAGDLEIVGRVTSALLGETQASSHRALRFRTPDGRHLVDYGVATAIDAAGRTHPMTTAFDGDAITLRLDGHWLGTAEFPVTVDPLVSRVELGAVTGETVRFPQVVRSADHDRLFVAEQRFSSGADADLIVRAYADDWTHLGTVFSDIGSTTSAKRPSLAIAEGADRLLLAYESSTFVSRGVRYYVHDDGDLTANSGNSHTFPRPSGSHDAEPSIGGSGGNYAYLVFRRDVSQFASNTAQSRVYGALIDAQAESVVVGPFDLHTFAGSNYDAEHPQVSGHSHHGGWVAVWQSYNYSNPGDDWDILAQRISPGGTLVGEAVLGNSSYTPAHKITPHVAGHGSEFAVAFLSRPNDGTKTDETSGERILFQRLHWPWSVGPTLSPTWTNHVEFTNVFELGAGSRNLAFDSQTLSIWGLAWRRLDTGAMHVTRLGFDGRVAEELELEPASSRGPALDPSICFHGEDMSFPIVYAGSESLPNRPVYGNHFAHGDAAATAHGPSCPGTATTSNVGRVEPFVGSERFKILLLNGEPDAPSLLAVGVAPASVPLPGSLGCTLLIDPNQLVINAAYGVTDGLGEWGLGVPIPSHTPDSTLHCQFIQLANGELRSSNRLQLDVR